jgi:hypothetical protein
MTTNPDLTKPASSNSTRPNSDSSKLPISLSASSSEQPESIAASSLTWPFVAVAAIALVGLGWHVLQHDADDSMQLATAPAIERAETVGLRPPEMTAAEVRMELYSSISAVRVTLQAMSNPATARTYLPQLQKAAERLDRVNGLVEQLSPAARRGMAASLAPTMRPLNHMFDRVLAMPEVAEMARPTIDQVRARLEALSRA